MKLLLLRLLAVVAGLFTRRTAALDRVLVIKPDHLGDLLLAAPALAALRERRPAARIVGLVGPWAGLIWRGHPALNALAELPFPGFERAPQARRPLRPYLLLLKYGLLLRRERFDAALLLRDDHWWGAALAAFAGIPRRIGHAHPLCAPLLTTALPYDPARHVTRQALDVVGALIDAVQPDDRPPTTDHHPASTPSTAFWKSVGGLGRQTTDDRRRPGRAGSGAAAFVFRPSSFVQTGSELPPGCTSSAPPLPRSPSPGHPPTAFTPAASDHLWADAWVAANLGPEERLVVIHPGTGGPTKHWPPVGWAAVADALAEEPRVRLLLTGGPGEEGLVAEVAALMARPALSLAGQTSVGQLTALLGRAALVLGVDSGPLHLAVSQGTPTVHLFGPSDHNRFGPWGDPARHRVIRAGLFCSPCGVFSACPRGTAGPECMAALSPDEVAAAARELLAAYGVRSEA